MMRIENAEPPAPIIREPYLLCETGSLLALNWLRTAAQVVEQLDTGQYTVLRRATIKALDDLLEHRSGCANCNAG